MSNSRTINFKTIEDFHKYVANAHVDIKSFYRFDFSEIENGLTSPIAEFPVLMLEAPSAELYSETLMVSNFNKRNVSFLVLDHAGERTDFDRQSEVLAITEGIALDIVSYFIKCYKENGHWLQGKFDINTVRIEKVGPIFDNMYGWNVLYEIRSQEKMCFVPEKWNFE